MNIGYAVLGTISTPYSGTEGKLLYGTEQAAVLAANQEAFNIRIGYAGANNTNVSNFQVGIFDVTASQTAATKLHSVALSIDNALHGSDTTPRWMDFPISAFNLSAFEGKTLGVMVTSPAANTGFNFLRATVTGAARRTHNNANGVIPSIAANGTATANDAWSICVQTRDRPVGVSLDSVTPAAVDNTQQLTAVISGNAAPGTVDFIAGGVTVAQSIVSWNYNASTNKTTVIINVTQGGLGFGQVTVRFTSGANVLTANVSLVTVAANSFVNISNPQNTVGYIFQAMEEGNYTDVSQVEWTDYPNTVVESDGLINQNVIRSFTARVRDGIDNTWSVFSTIEPVLAGAEAVPVGVGCRASVGFATASGVVIGAVANPQGVRASANVGTAVAIGGARAIAAGVSCSARVGYVTIALSDIPPVSVGATLLPDFSVKGCSGLIVRTEGDTHGVVVQFHSGGRPQSLIGWSQFELVVDPSRNPTDESTRVMRTQGAVIDATKGQVYLPVDGALQAGKYFFNARCITPMGKRLTFLKGIYEVGEGIP